MLGFDDNGHAFGARDALNGFGNLSGQVFLNLQTAGVHVDDAGKLGQAQYLASGQVGNVALADERQHMVLTHAVEFDILNHDHFIHGRFEYRIVHQVAKVLLVPAREELHGLGRAHWSVLQTLAIRVFAQAIDDGTEVP